MLVGMAEVIEATLQLDRGRRDDARRLLRAAISRFEQEGVPGGLAEALSLCAVDEIDRGDLGAAERHAHRALDLATGMHDRGLEAQALETLALAAASRGAHTDAATALGRAASMRREGGRPACRTEQAVANRADTLVREALGAQLLDEFVARAVTAATS
jgi:tetratricopeptide (TPR) repeat protein